MSFPRGVAVPGFPFGLINKNDGTPITDGTVTGYIIKDGADRTTLSGSPRHVGGSQWVVDLTASDMDAEIIGIEFVCTDAIPIQISVKTFSQTVLTLITNSVMEALNNYNLPDSDIDKISTIVTAAIATYLETIEVRPTVTVLGPCKKTVDQAVYKVPQK